MSSEIKFAQNYPPLKNGVLGGDIRSSYLIYCVVFFQGIIFYG